MVSISDINSMFQKHFLSTSEAITTWRRSCRWDLSGRLFCNKNLILNTNWNMYSSAILEHKDDIRFLTAILFVTIISTIIIPVATPFMTHTKPIAAFELVFFVRAVYLKKIFRKIMRLHM